jgi:hypothetical protein
VTCEALFLRRRPTIHPMSTNGLSLSPLWRPPLPTEAGSDACERLRRALRPVSQCQHTGRRRRYRPTPSGAYHHRLEVVLPGKADRDGTVILVVVIDLVTRHWAAGHETDESLSRQRAGIPMAVVARLPFLGSVDASGRADDRTSRYRRPTLRSHARFPCRWYQSLSGRMRTQPQSKVR